VVDTFGQTGSDNNTIDVLANFSRYSAATGVAPAMYISQPTGVIHYSYHNCQSDLNAYEFPS
jgi:hypothetical protein